MEFRKMAYLDTNKVRQMELRPKDKNEIFALAGKGQYEVISNSVAISDEVYVIEEDQEGITGVLGVAELSDGEGMVWMLTEKDYSESPVKFVRNTKKLIDRWSDEYRGIGNYIPKERAEDDFKFLEILGFDVNFNNTYYFYDEKTLFVKIYKE